MRFSYEALDAICPNNEDNSLSFEDKLACLGKDAIILAFDQLDMDLDSSLLNVKAHYIA